MRTDRTSGSASGLVLRLILLGAMIGLSRVEGGEAYDYAFDGRMSRAVLENYLAKAVCHDHLCSLNEKSSPTFNEELRLIANIRPKLIYRAVMADYIPTLPAEDAYFQQVPDKIRAIHAIDPDIIIQGRVSESVLPRVNDIPIPAWVFTAFDLPVETRNFDHGAMLFANPKLRGNFLGGKSSQIDVSKQESRLYYYYRARKLIDAGCEGIHWSMYGGITGRADRTGRHMSDLLTRVRRYATEHARRHFVLCDAFYGAMQVDGTFLFDCNRGEILPEEIEGRPPEVELHLGQHFYGKKYPSGRTPSGWTTNALPFIVEFDNGVALEDRIGTNTPGRHVWGLCEIDWFTMLLPDTDRRNHYLVHFWEWMRRNCPEGFVEMPVARYLHKEFNGRRHYFANDPVYFPSGYGQEATIKELFDRDWRAWQTSPPPAAQTDPPPAAGNPPLPGPRKR